MYIPVSYTHLDVYKRQLADSGSFFVNIKEHVEDGQRSLYVMKTIIALVEGGWRYVDQLIWTKPGLPGGWSNRLRNDFEPVHFFTKKEKIDWMVQLIEADEERLETLPLDLVDMYEDIFHFTKLKKIKFNPRSVGKTSDRIRVPGSGKQTKGRTGNITVRGRFKRGKMCIRDRSYEMHILPLCPCRQKGQ